MADDASGSEESKRNIERRHVAYITRAAYLYAAAVMRGLLQSEPDLSGAEILGRFEAEAASQYAIWDRLDTDLGG